MAAAGSAAALPVYNAYIERHPDEVSQNIVLPVLLHVAIYAAVGAGGGLAFAIGLGDAIACRRVFLARWQEPLSRRSRLTSSAPRFFPWPRYAQVVPETWQSRLISRLVVGVCVALVVAYVAGHSRRESR